MDLRDTQDPETLAVGEVYLRAIADVYHQKLHAHLDELSSLPAPWRDVGAMSDTVLRLTAAEAMQLYERVWALVESMPRADDPVDPKESPDARSVVVQLQVFRRPGEAT
jgi:hypothetical protein